MTLYVVCGVILTAAALLTTFRALVGPSTLDRVVAIDALVAVAMCGLAVFAAYTGDTATVPAVVALSLVGFLGSASVARFRVPDDRPDRRN